MRRLLLILGGVLGVLVALGIFIWVQATRPVPVEVPVAIDDIPAGTILKPELFRISRMSNVDQQTIARWITLSDWSEADGKLTTSDIKAGFPVARVQINPDTPEGAESRLSVVITGTNDYYVIIPTTPDEVGNYVQPSDRVDLIITIPPRDLPALTISSTTGSGVSVQASETLSQSAIYPVSKLVMQNMTVLRVEREKPREQSSSSQNADQAKAQPQVNDVKRLYVKVDRDQLEVLSFVLNTGVRNIAVRSASGSKASLPTDGVTWEDFAKWFFAQRGTNSDGIKPFDAVSPSQPK